MNLNKLSLALVIGLIHSSASAAALDRSGQSIAAFLQPNNYFEAGVSVLDANVSGNMRNGWNIPSTDIDPVGNDISGKKLGDMAETFMFPSFALKYQLTDQFSLGLIYDQPFGAKAKYSENDSTHSSPPKLNPNTGSETIVNSGPFQRNGESTQVKVDTQSFTLMLGYQPNENWNIYAAPVYQGVKGNVQLRGSVYGPLGGVFCTTLGNSSICDDTRSKDTLLPSNGYSAKISEKFEWGYLAGIAFQIPEIALKTSLTYRSEITYHVDIDEDMPIPEHEIFSWPSLGGLPILGPNYEYEEGKTKIVTPQSINLDFQTGIMTDTLAFINLRWVDWSNFKIRPQKFGELSSALTQKVAGTPRGFDLIAYEKDQYSVNFGVARKLNQQWAVSLLGGWDSGAGNPTSTLGPVDGFWSAGLGGQFSPTNNTFLQAGARYFWFGDAKAQSASWFGTPRYDADFKNNDAIGYSLKIGYRF